MQKRIQKVTRNVLDRSTGFEEIYEKWSRTRLELRTVTQRLQQGHQWLPVLRTALRSAEEAHKRFDKLRAHRVQLLKTLHQLQEGMEKFMLFRPGLPGPSGPSGGGLPGPGPSGGELPGFEPTREQLEQAVLTKRILDQYALRSVRPYQILSEDESPPPPWTAVLWSFQLTEYPDIQWSDDENATFSKTWWPFDPYYDVQRGVVAGRFRINNPAPYDYPCVEEEHDWAQLMVCAALSFDIPAPTRDSMVFYEANLVFYLSPDYTVRDFIFDGSCLLFEQRDAATGAPQSVSDFEHIGNGISNDPDSPLKRYDDVPVARSFFAPAGTPSKVHLGFTWNLSVSSGDGGTSPGCWDNFIVFPPDGSDVWGLKVTQVPV